MNKMKQFLKRINRKCLPSMNEIAGDEEMFNSYMDIFGPPRHSEAHTLPLARAAMLGGIKSLNKSKRREIESKV